MIQQLYSPVRWVELVQTLIAQGIDTIVECGPGKILTGLNKRIDKSIKYVAVHDTATLQVIMGEHTLC
ncbi:MAG: ACP S-malonyltransferase [Gammaproteobacteria bacterium]|nr:ACP S-malonyltransferase [Gammaproteobacteria bacterium]